MDERERRDWEARMELWAVLAGLRNLPPDEERAARDALDRAEERRADVRMANEDAARARDAEDRRAGYGW